MTAQFQIIHFEPDPFSGARVPLGALVESGGGVELVTAWLPGPRCLGGDEVSAVARLILDSLRRVNRLGELPMSVGPQVHLAPAQSVPAGASNAADWVREHVLPRRPSREAELGDNAPLGPRRQTAGYRFFETWHVAQWVKKGYRPPTAGLERPDLIREASHYVAGREQLLLMEPIVTTRESFADDLKEVFNSFLAWRGLERYEQTAQQRVFLAYVHGGSGERASETRRALRHLDHVFDVDQPGDRGELLALIKDVGTSASSGGLLQ